MCSFDCHHTLEISWNERVKSWQWVDRGDADAIRDVIPISTEQRRRVRDRARRASQSRSRRARAVHTAVHLRL